MGRRHEYPEGGGPGTFGGIDIPVNAMGNPIGPGANDGSSSIGNSSSGSGADSGASSASATASGGGPAFKRGGKVPGSKLTSMRKR